MKLQGIDRTVLKKVLLLILISLAVLRFFVIPARDYMLREKAGLETQMQILHQKKLQLERLKEERAKGVEASPSKQPPIPAYIYSADRDPFEIQLSLLKDLLKALQERNLTLQSFSLPTISHGKTLTEIPLELRFQGRTLDVLSFLEYLEGREKRILIRDCTITESARRLSVTMTLTVLKSEI